MAAELGVGIEQIRHSGKTRARETAEILGDVLPPREGVVATSDLGPLDDVEPVAEALDQEVEPMILVGHLPFMERLAGRLLTGRVEQPVIEFNNAGIACPEKMNSGRCRIPSTMISKGSRYLQSASDRAGHL